MPISTVEVSADGEEGDRPGWKGRVFQRRRLKQMVLFSGILFLSSASVYALSPKEVGPTGHFPFLIRNKSVAEGRRELCNLYLDRELLASFGTVVPDGIDKSSSEFDLCGDRVAQEDYFQGKEPTSLELEIRTLVTGYPIETMAPVIATYDREVARLIVGIAKKESDWGRHVPTQGGRDCYNYWGYKGSGSLGTALGYACFETSEEAVKIVGDRLSTLVSQRQASSPEKLIVWKCGSSCSGHSPESVRSWIADVRVYYDRIAK